MNALHFPGRIPAGYSRVFLILVVLGTPTWSAGQSSPDLSGVWSTTMTRPQDVAWRIEDYGCFFGCPSDVYARLRTLLQDPANTQRPFELLMLQAWRFGAKTLADKMTPQGLALRDRMGNGDAEIIRCEPLGFVQQVLGPLPIRVEQRADEVILSYEEWNVGRTIHMDGRGHPSNIAARRYGHSIGRYDGPTLVIETSAISAGHLWSAFGDGAYTDQLRTVERYTRDDGWLKLEFTLIDPNVLREPLVYEKFWRLTSDVTLLEHSCETIAGQP